MVMKTLTGSLFLTAFLLIACFAYAQKPYTLKSYKMTVSGTSTMHDWTSDVTKLEFSGKIMMEGNAIKQVKDVVITIPVKSIKSTKGKTMDNKTYEAFKSDKNPNIQYKLTNSDPNDNSLKSTGSLNMAGVTNTVTVNSTATILANGDIQVKGSQKINMKDYKMDPPTAMMGAIKVGEEVTINFDITVTPAK
jgi:polyisoprenoid-binding protein YceI